MRVILSILLTLFGITTVQAYALKQNGSSIRHYNCNICATLSHESLSTNWPSPQITTIKHLKKRRKKSRKYKITATYKQLREGIPVVTEGEGAVIRISPVNPQQAKKKPQFRIQNKQGLNLRLLDASTLYSEDEVLKDSPFANNTLILSTLKPDLGHGEFKISSDADATINEDTLYNIHIFDRHSTIELSVETDKARYFYGDELKIKIRLHEGELNFPIEDLKLTLVTPKDKKIPLSFQTLDSNVIESSIPLNFSEVTRGETWYVIAQSYAKVNDSTVRRRVHVSFSYAIPSAKIREITQINPGTFTFSAAVDVATESRYALEAILYTKDENDRAVALQTAQTAKWLPAGTNSIDFSFNLPQKENYSKPFYLGYIRLIDYGQLKPVFEYDAPIELAQLAKP